MRTRGECVKKKGERCVYRGGNWNNGTNAGVFYLNGNNSRTNSNTNIGFRSALALFVLLPAGHGSAGTARQKGHISRLTKPKIYARAARRRGRHERQLAGGGHREQRANRAGWPILCKQVKDGREPTVWQPQGNG